MHELHGAGGDGQSQPAAVSGAAPCLVGAVEHFEKVRQGLFGHTGAVIGGGEDDPPVFRGDGEAELSAAAVFIFGAVGEEVHEDPLEEQAVGLDVAGRAALPADVQSFPAEGFPAVGGRGLQKFVQVDAFQRNGLFPMSILDRRDSWSIMASSSPVRRRMICR